VLADLSVDRGGSRPYNCRSPIGACAVSVAQLAEHQTVALAVAGSIPVTHPIIFRRL
jgi:hypothetical protein